MTMLDLTKKLKSVQYKSDNAPKKVYPCIELGKKIDQYDALDEKEKAAEAQKKILKEEFIQTCLKYREENSYGGDTIELLGTEGRKRKLVDQRFSTVDYSEEMEVIVQKLVGKKNYKDYFTIAREIKLSKGFLNDEKKLTDLITLIEEKFGLDGVLEVKQVIKPKDRWQEERYLQKIDQIQFDELFKPVRAMK